MSEINSSVLTKFSNVDLILHDCFVNKEDLILYLVSQKEELFWCEEQYLPRYLLDEFFIRYSRKICEKNPHSCRVNKEIQIPCIKKCRTTGVLLSVYNCGIVSGYREIFAAESLTQVGIF